MSNEQEKDSLELWAAVAVAGSLVVGVLDLLIEKSVATKEEVLSMLDDRSLAFIGEVNDYHERHGLEMDSTADLEKFTSERFAMFRQRFDVE